MKLSSCFGMSLANATTRSPEPSGSSGSELTLGIPQPRACAKVRMITSPARGCGPFPRHRFVEQLLEPCSPISTDKRRGRRAAGRGHVLAQRRGIEIGAVHELAGARHGRDRELPRERFHRGPPLAGLRPEPRRAGKRKPGPSPTRRSPHPSGLHPRPRSPRRPPKAALRTELRWSSRRRRRWRRRPVMPRPIAAGVFGIARTTAAPAADGVSKLAIVRPAAMEMTSVSRPGQLRQRREHRVHDLRLDRDQHDARPADRACRWRARRAMPCRARCAATSAGAATGPGQDTWPDRARASQPASRAPPILPAPASTSGQAARTHGHQRCNRLTQAPAQAWPSVWNIVDTSASRLSLPAQTTNWKA